MVRLFYGYYRLYQCSFSLRLFMQRKSDWSSPTGSWCCSTGFWSCNTVVWTGSTGLVFVCLFLGIFWFLCHVAYFVRVQKLFVLVRYAAVLYVFGFFLSDPPELVLFASVDRDEIGVVRAVVVDGVLVDLVDRDGQLRAFRQYEMSKR